jgi:acetyltransferase-like isoleucine patch superfamily enzyme
MELKFRNRLGSLFASRSGKVEIGKKTYVSENAQIKTKLGGKILVGDRCAIHDYVLIFSYGGSIEIGDHCDINPFSILYGHGGLRIGNRVLIAGHCMIIPNNHNISDLDTPIQLQGSSAKGIIVEDNVWIGHGVSILDGVRIGRGSVIAAGAVVTSDVKENTIVGGVPAKVIRSRAGE